MRKVATQARTAATPGARVSVLITRDHQSLAKVVGIVGSEHAIEAILE